MQEDTKIEHRLSELKNLAPTGFALGFHVVYTTPTFMFQTYSSDWLEHYASKGYLMLDPVVHWGFENTGLIRWSDMVHLDTAGVLKDAADFGLNFGATCAVNDNDRQSFGGFSRNDREFTNDECDTLQLLFKEIHGLTAQREGLSPETKQSLKAMSVNYTQTLNQTN
jgi:LuxR family transcriptional regulator